MNRIALGLSVVAVVGGALGCGGGSSNTGVDQGVIAPTLTITSPVDNATLMLDDSTTDVDVAYTVTNFTLKAPTTCGATTPCGHIHLFIDGSACNDKTGAAPLPYNSASAVSPASAGFDYCPTWPDVSGTHTIKLELHNDDHSPVKDSAGATISSSVSVTAQYNGTVVDGGTNG